MFKKFLGLLIALHAPFAVADEEFNASEIRVIRPKFFKKSMRVELGLEGSAIMNSPFIYTYFVGGRLGFHLSEQFGIYGEGFTSIVKEKYDCSNLGETFEITPQVYPITRLMGGGLVYTPIYGKYQLESGDVLYFDTFLLAGGGVGNVKNNATFCRSRESALTTGEVTETIQAGSYVNGGLGQRFFLTRSLAFNWALRVYFVQLPIPGATMFSNGSQMNLQAGLSFFL